MTCCKEAAPSVDGASSPTRTWLCGAIAGETITTTTALHTDTSMTSRGPLPVTWRHRCPPIATLHFTAPASSTLSLLTASQTAFTGDPAYRTQTAFHTKVPTRSGIKPARSSPSAVVVHAAAAHPAVPSVQQPAVARFLSQPSLFSGTLCQMTCSLHRLSLPSGDS